MSVQRLTNGKWRVRVKVGGREVYSKVHKTRREAVADEAEQSQRLSHGTWVDPRAGRAPVSQVVQDYLASRPGMVASKTLVTERYLLARISPAFARLPVGAVTRLDVQEELGRQAESWSTSSVKRFRSVLSALFSNVVDRQLRYDNPVKATRVPPGAADRDRTEMYPFSLAELREVAADLMTQHPDGDLALFLGLTGLRWGEVEALRVRDVLEIPHRAVRVSRSSPTGHPVRSTTKGGKDRVVPLVDEVWAIVARRLGGGRGPDDLLFTNTRGDRLNGWAWKSLVNWADYARGRRVHDLRHTAATLWLSSGVPPKTVQNWLGHASATLTLDRYAHFIPTSEGAHGLAIMNAHLDSGGTSVARRRPLQGEGGE